MTGYIHSTESFGTVDGPGVRFVVFMQGCPMRCLYCHNPDTWAVGKGEKRTAQSLIDEYESLKEFLKNGGITVTGGEPLMQLDFVTELFTLAKAKGIHTCIDSSGITFTPDDTEKFDKLISLTDLVMLDIKHIDPERHKALTGHENKNILAFAEYLSKKGIPVWIRHVLVPGVTDDEHFLFELGRFIGGIKTLKALDVLPYHTMAKSKYQSLGIPYPLGDIPPASKEQAAHARDVIMKGLYDRLSGKGSH
ncbi:pyruvate formate-lyase-activating protein [Ruminococcus sp. NK3A76]|uniref:pyruvate formate-lyase-activating protein n=1 Tax=Ruminococcus sp. NK3A76 TaxID=877411 RepID=UPI00048E5DA4|nr:pyruvate formate-lyase-activating protein [Ruminococcus sp. NK3A76]